MINGKIYKLINTDNTMCYIGSTTRTLEQRKAEHEYDYKKWKNGKYPYVTSFKLIESDEDGLNIFLIENVACNSNEELIARERYHIDINQCVNKIKPTRTLKEYYKDNKAEILEKQREYDQKNKDKINEKHNCECGSCYIYRNKFRHIKSIKHKSFLQSKVS